MAIFVAAYREGFVARQTRGTTASELGRLRCLIAGVALFYVLVWEGSLAQTAALPPELIDVVDGGFLERLPSTPILDWASMARSSAALSTLKWGTALFLLLGMCGIATRASLLLGAVGYFAIGGVVRSYNHLFHTGLVPLYLLAVLLVVPCGDGFAVLRLRRSRRPADAPVYGWSRYLLWIVLALCYVMAGFSKLRASGLGWAQPDNLRAIVAVDNLNPMEIEFGLGLSLLGAPDVFWAALGMGTLVLEIGYVSVLWSRTARAVLPLLVGSMHASIAILQNVVFLDLIVLQLLFFELRALPHLRVVPSSGDPAPEPRTLRYAFLAGIWVLLSVGGAVWIGNIGHYPLSSFPMYASLNDSGRVSYYRLQGYDAAGRSVDLRLEEFLPVFRDARYRDLLSRTFDESRDDVALTRIYQAIGTQYRSASEREDLVRLEAVRREWDYRTSPGDTAYGSTVERFVVELPAVTSTGDPPG